MNIAQFEEEFRGKFKRESFINEEGEEFKIYLVGPTVFFAGDETDDKVVPLFHSSFNIWSTHEIQLLGIAMQRLAEAEEPLTPSK